MSAGALPSQDRLIELLVDRATEGLDASHEQELAELLPHAPTDLPVMVEATAASVHVALIAHEMTPMPPALRQRVLQTYEQNRAAPSLKHPAFADSQSTETKSVTGQPLLARLGWLAAAACLALAAVAWWPSATTDATPAQPRAAILRDAADVVRMPWTALVAPTYSEVAGDVVWSNTRQAGFMRFAGLPANDPAKRQYQLWIVDPTRDKHPIDGGVFDVPPDRSEVIIPIDAKLPVNEAKVFAITLEQPGGVVVSEGPLLIVAKTDDAKG